MAHRREDADSMKLAKVLLEELTVRPRHPAGLDARSTESTMSDWLGSSKNKYKKVAKKHLESCVAELSDAQRLFWANGTHALLIVLQAMDAAGKDGTIRHVMSGVTRKAATSKLSKNPPMRSSITTSCGKPPRRYHDEG
jgi:polyphosphate kinase 2 (PPK2 family)